MKRILSVAALALTALGFAGSSASAQTQREFDLVRNWYQRYLGREPDQLGHLSWSQQLAVRPAPDVLADIIGSPEYYQRHGNTPEGFVIALYYEVLGRRPDGNEVNNWLVQLSRNGGNRALTARQFLAAAGDELATRPVQIYVPPPQTAPIESLPLTPRIVPPSGFLHHYRY